MARTNESPGVEIREKDLSQNPARPVGTSILIPGFSQSGPVNEIIQASTYQEWEQIYGKPTTPAERYFAHTVRAAFNSPGNIYTSRMAYGSGSGEDVADKFSALVYPVFPRPSVASILENPALSAELSVYFNAINEIQTIVLQDIPVDGEFCLTDGTASTVAISFSALTSEVETAIETAFTSITDVSATKVTGVSSVTYTVMYHAPSGSDVTNLSSVVACNTLVSTPNVNEQQVLSASCVAISGNFTLSYAGTATSVLPFSATAVEVETALETIAAIDVDVSGSMAAGYTVTFNGVTSASNVSQLTVTTNTLSCSYSQKEIQTITFGMSVSALSADTFSLSSTSATTSITVPYSANAIELETLIETSFGDITDVTVVGDISASGPVTITFENPIYTDYNEFIAINPPALSTYPNPVVTETQVGSAATLPSLTVTTTVPGSAGTPVTVTITEVVAGSGASPVFDTTLIYSDSGASILVSQYVSAYGWDLDKADVYYFGEPSNIEMNAEQFRQFEQNQVTYNQKAGTVYEYKTFDDILTKSGVGMILINNKRLTVNEKFEGYYIGVADNANLNPATDYDSVLGLKGLNEVTAGIKGSSYTTIPNTRLNFALSADSQIGEDGSMSETMENLATFDIANNQFSDTLSIGVFKVRPSTLNPDVTKLDYTLAEKYVGSLNFYAEQFLPEGGAPTSFFIESEAERATALTIKINPYISKLGGDWYNEDRITTKKVRMLSQKREVNYTTVARYKSDAFLDDADAADLYEYTKAINAIVDATSLKHANNAYAHGVFKVADGTSRETGNIPAKLDRVFELAENLDLYQFDVICEAGLGTIYTATSGGAAGAKFDDTAYMDISYLFNTQIQSADAIMSNYRTIANAFVNFCAKKRKDCMTILDGIRQVYVQGENRPAQLDLNEGIKFFSKHIYWPQRHLFGTINTSYAATFANWMKVLDRTLNKQVWVPASGFIAADFANNDAIAYPWIAPAGFTRGILTDINDLAIMPTQKQRDMLYKIGVNAIANFPNDGFVIFGQKTLQSKPSAFDRINVRRMFLYAGRAVRETSKYFVFEPNTTFTRTQVHNILTPIFQFIKDTQGLYDFEIVVDERNNPPAVIDQNELVIDVYMKPVRAAEFILVNLLATRTSQDFSELIQ